MRKSSTSLEQIFHECGRILIQHRETLNVNWERQHESKDSQAQWVFAFFLESLPFLQEANDEQFIRQFYMEWIQRFLVSPASAPFTRWLAIVEKICLKVLAEHLAGSFDGAHIDCIRSFFLKWTSSILEYSPANDSPSDLEEILSQVFSYKGGQFLPWIVFIGAQQETFFVKQWIVNPLYEQDWEPYLPVVANLQARSIISLIERMVGLLHGTSSHKHLSMHPILWKNEVIYICSMQMTPASDLAEVSQFIIRLLRIKEHVAAQIQERNRYLAVAQFDRRLIGSRDFQDLINQISMGFVSHLPFQRCAVFTYLPEAHSGQGLWGIDVDIPQIQSIIEKVERIPAIQKAVITKSPYYVSEATNEFPQQYVDQFRLHSTVVIPLISNSTVVGTVIADQGADSQFQVDLETLATAKIFAYDTGNMLKKYFSRSRTLPSGQPFPTESSGGHSVTPREVEVLTHMAEGLTMKEIAEKLYISEFTVRDHITSITKKLGAKNKTHAVASAMRLGIIN